MTQDPKSSSSRHLHITIHEDSGNIASGRDDRRFVGGSDPRPSAVSLPPPSDPAKSAVSLPPASNPDEKIRRLGTDCAPGAPWAAVQATVQDCPPASCSCCCDADRGGARASTAEQEDWSGFVIVRLIAGIRSLTAESLWQLAHELHLPGLASVLRLEFAEETWGPGPHEDPPAEEPYPPNVLESWPLIHSEACATREDIIKAIDAAEQAAATSNVPPLFSLVSYWRVDVRRHPTRVPELIARFQALAEVALAYAEITATDPSFDSDQEYFERGPVGFGARFARERLVQTPASIKVCDLEQAWHLDHREFTQGSTSLLNPPFVGANRNDDDKNQGSHGTAVIGELGGIADPSPPDDKIITGAAEGFGNFPLASHYLPLNFPDARRGTNGHITSAIAYATVLGSPPLTPGDILLLEVQRGGKPTEIADPADRDAIRLASALGVIVVEAAGNGGVDLDRYRNPHSGRSLNPRDPSFIDSGAILVGAAAAELPHDRRDFSCFGARVDCYAWGDRVTTCGYGDLYGEDETDFYTDTFSGTSSASPMVAGAAALIQAFAGSNGGKLLPLRMRKVLSDPQTGTPQGPNVPGAIGIMPDLGEILTRRLQLTENVYLRRTPQDDGSQEVATGALSSSPDIVMTFGPDTDAAQRLGEGPAASDPAPGEPINTQRFLDPISKLRLYLRARNRGSAEGFARALLFTSSAATFITPDRWNQTAEIGLKEVPVGDTLRVSEGVLRTDLRGIPWNNQGNLKLDPPPSFLAVYQTARKAFGPNLPQPDQPLPPGPPYFRLREFLDFLRGPGVAWRNVYPVEVEPNGQESAVTLSFLFAGTPDRSRSFDFEIEQRLPAGTGLALGLESAALQSKLVRDRKDLPNSGPIDLAQRRTELPRVRIAPDENGAASFQIDGPLRTGHSLSIRQIWRGIEVGRISWWFREAP
ncbi:MAG: S8 family serine peptidase [Acidobacteriota bacterium]